MIEKRKIPRMAANYEVFVNFAGRTSVARSRDISVYGIGVYLNEQLRPGEQAEVTVILPEGTLHLALKGMVIYCVTNPDPSLKPYPFLVGVQFTEESGEAVNFILGRGEISQHRVSHTLSINAEIGLCYRAICDFLNYPKWVRMMEEVKILERYPDGRGKRVEFLLNIFLRKVRYVLDYFYDDSGHTLSWLSAGGDVVSIKGRYSFRSVGEKITSATYDLDIMWDFPVPNRMKQYFSGIFMRKSMKDFKNFVEKSI